MMRLDKWRKSRLGARFFRDPDRWVDADAQRDDWVTTAAWMLIVAGLVTITAVFVGMVIFDGK